VFTIDTFAGLRLQRRLLRDLQIAQDRLAPHVLGGEAPGGASVTAALYATNGLIIDAIYRRSGMAGLRRFAMLHGEPASLVARLSEFVGPIGPDVNAWWRAEAAAAARR